MLQVRKHICARQSSFSAHPFFSRLTRNEPLEDIARFAPALTFWVYAFQDALRLNEERVNEPALRRIARGHRLADAAHERWFLSDLEALPTEAPEVEDLFGPAHRATRDAAYAILAEVFRAASDADRIALLLSVGSAVHVFFGRVIRYMQRAGVGHRLRYFGPKYLEGEGEHDMFEEELEAWLEAFALTPEQNTSALDVVDRTYRAFHQLLGGLDAAITAPRSARAATPVVV